MPEQELREVIARAMYEADLDYYCESDKPPFGELPYWRRDSYLDRATHIIEALAARVPDGIPAAVERYGNARGALEAARAVPETVDFEFAEVEHEAAASERDLLALVAVARPGVTVPEFTALNLPPMSDDSSWTTADDFGSQIKQRIQGIAIHSEIAAHYHGLREDDGDENDLISRKHYDVRNDAMRDVHRLVDALTPEATDEH